MWSRSGSRRRGQSNRETFRSGWAASVAGTSAPPPASTMCACAQAHDSPGRAAPLPPRPAGRSSAAAAAGWARRRSRPRPRATTTSASQGRRRSRFPPGRGSAAKAGPGVELDRGELVGWEVRGFGARLRADDRSRVQARHVAGAVQLQLERHLRAVRERDPDGQAGARREIDLQAVVVGYLCGARGAPTGGSGSSRVHRQLRRLGHQRAPPRRLLGGLGERGRRADHPRAASTVTNTGSVTSTRLSTAAGARR